MLPLPPSPSPLAPAHLLLPLLLLVAAAVHAQDKPLPDFLHICKRNDPQLADCIKESVEGLRSRLAAGIPELNVPPLDPMHIQRLVLNQNPNLNVVANDIKAYHTTAFDIRDIQVDPKKGTFKFRVNFPKLDIEGTYDVNGRILLLPVKGTGPVTLNITDVSADVDIQSGRQQRDGAEYLSLETMAVHIKVGGGSIRLDNIFAGDRLLGEVVNTAANANFARTLDELKPSVEQSLAAELALIGRSIVSSFPISQLMPDE